MSTIEDNKQPQQEPRREQRQTVSHSLAAIFQGSGTMKAEVLTPDLAAFVTATSSTANAVIDSASAELTKRITKQIEEMETERQAPQSPSQK